MRPSVAAAVARGLIGAVFQPIVDLSTGALAAFESLARPLPGSGFPNVTAMFEQAEASGELWSLEEATRAAVLAAAAGWPSGVRVTFNSTPVVFADDRFPDSVIEAVRRTEGLSPQRVVLEITERAETRLIDGLSRNVETLKAAGFQIAVDDVGAGSSGLNRIMALRPHWLKLDRELVDHLDQDPYRQNLIRFFVHFARLGGASLVAEGIERVEELGALIDLGVVLGQGYLLGKPGARDQTVSPDIAAWICERAGLRERVRLRDPRRRPVSDVLRASMTADAETPAAEAARSALADVNNPGIAVVSGRRCLGWLNRERLQRAALETPTRPVRDAAPESATAVDFDTPLGDVIAAIVARDDETFAEPVLITKDGEVVGMAPVRDVLRAVGAGPLGAGGHTAPLTGLPDRAVCDQQINRMIAGRLPGDVLFVDVRGLTSYNHDAGYEMGDVLIQQVAAVVESVVRPEQTDGRAWHLGDDRFLALAPAGRLSAVIEELLLQFERTRVRTVSADAGPAGSAPSLRVLVIPDAFQRVASVGELHRLADQLRRAARPSDGGSQVIVDRREWPRDARLSA